MDLLSHPELFKTSFLFLALILGIIFLAIYGIRKLRKGFRDALDSEGIMETGKAPGSNKEMSFVFNTFQHTLHEITQKKKELIHMHQEAVERVRQMERYNECILESMVSGVVAFDREGNLTSMNDAASYILGWPKDMDAVGRPYLEVLEGSDKLKDILQLVLRKNQKILREETSFTMLSGELKWLGVNASPLKGDSGEMIGATLLFTDLTEVKELQRQVELKNRLAAMGEMSAGIAHEFRNSLGAVLGYARLIDRQANDNKILKESAEGIMSEVKNFDATLTEFLTFARPTELKKETCILSDVVNESIDLLSEEIKKRGTRVDFQDGDTFGPILLDRTLMRQALTNLIKNALEAVGEDGVVAIKEKRLVDREELWIEDNGCGISPEEQRKIFEPFFTTKREGTGLGLSITHKTILSHQGSLTVKSDQGKGTLMILSLPLQNSAA